MAGGVTHGMHPSIGEFATRRRGSMTPYEIAFADQQRAVGRSWQTIANMLQRPVDDVRSVCDADRKERR